MLPVPYFLRKGYEALTDSPGLSALTAATLGAALLLLGVYVMALQNFERLALVWGRAGNVSCYLQEGPAAEPEREARWEATRAALAALPHVDHASLVRPAEALQRFRARGPQAAALVEGVTDDLLPPSVEVYLAGGFVDLPQVRALAEQAGEVDGVATVDFGAEEFAQLSTLIGLLRLGGLLFGSLMLGATAIMVANTLRLAVYQRRDEIAILQLVGATHRFIGAPFVAQATFWGLAGGALAVTGLLLGDRLVAPRLAAALAPLTGGLPLRLFAPPVAALIVGVGVALALGASLLALRRCLRQELG